MSKIGTKPVILRLKAVEVMLLVLFGCGQSNVPPQTPKNNPGSGQVSATVFFCTTADPQCRTAINAFEVQKLRDLFVMVAWRGVRGQHEQALEFKLQDGNLYQRLTNRFDTATTATSRGEPVVVQVLPVAGTFITQHSLHGTWSVEVFLDDRLITRGTFTLEPGQP